MRHVTHREERKENKMTVKEYQPNPADLLLLAEDLAGEEEALVQAIEDMDALADGDPGQAQVRSALAERLEEIRKKMPLTQSEAEEALDGYTPSEVKEMKEHAYLLSLAKRYVIALETLPVLEGITAELPPGPQRERAAMETERATALIRTASTVLPEGYAEKARTLIMPDGIGKEEQE